MLTTDITFEKIVEKTKRMLGKNYRGDKEMIPVYSGLSTIEGHTDSFLAISNGGFTNEEVALIKERTNNYAWWVANKGYLVDETRKSLPALFIYGSETGNAIPDVLNFNGVAANGFYAPVRRTDVTGNINNSVSHMYVQVLLDGAKKEFELDITGINDGILTLDGIDFEFYPGRLYPEDKIILDNNIVYPIYLVSNLEYYYIPVLGELGEPLGGAHDAEPVERNNLEILEDTCEMVIHEAAQWTNRPANQRLINDCWPVIVKCSCMAYLNRGVEGLNSQSELGQQNVYGDWVSVLHQQAINRRYIL